jgi:hypothetical protein
MAIPRNKQKRAVGRPKKWESAEAMQEAIDKYFDDCREQERPVTVTGLAYTLDLSRQGLINYENEQDFFDTVRRAKLRVEQAIDEYLQIGNAQGAKFSLINNYDWKEKNETAVTGDNINISMNFGGKGE